MKTADSKITAAEIKIRLKIYKFNSFPLGYLTL